MLETHFLLENLWISEPSLGILEKFQRSSALPIIKYNCVVYIFESTVLVIYLYLKIYFPIDHHCKIQSELSDPLEKGRIACTFPVNEFDCKGNFFSVL